MFLSSFYSNSVWWKPCQKSGKTEEFCNKPGWRLTRLEGLLSSQEKLFSFSCHCEVGKHCETEECSIFKPRLRGGKKVKHEKNFFLVLHQNIYQQLRVNFHQLSKRARSKRDELFHPPRKKRAMSFAVHLIKVKKVLSHFQLEEQ